MAAPPQITFVLANNDIPIITNGMMVRPSTPSFRFTGAKVDLWDTSYPHGYFYIARGITGAAAQLPFRVEFDTDAQDFGIFTLGTRGKYRLQVDGQYASLEAQDGPPADGNLYWLRITFTNGVRKSIALTSSGQAFGGAAIGSDDRVYAPTNSLGPRCIVLGDSFSEGMMCYASRLAGLTGWEVWSSGVGGTGYLNPGSAGRVKFRERVQADVIAYSPNIVLVAGGLNDGAYAPAEIEAEAGALYDTITSNLPSARLIVLGPWWPRGIPSQFILDTRDALKRAASQRGLEFIDSIVSATVRDINAGWITGSGNVSNPEGDGNADIYISSDGTHPTDLGNQYLALKVAERLKSLSVPNPAPELSMHLLPGLVIRGTPGRQYRIQRSDAAPGSEWTDVYTLSLTNNPQLWVDLSATNRVRAFYRALLLP